VTNSDPKFEVFASNGESWLRSATALLNSAQLVWTHRVGKGQATLGKHMRRSLPMVSGLTRGRMLTVHRQLRYGSTFMLLAGLGIENLLKASRAKQLHAEGRLFQVGRNGRPELARAIAHHRIDDLAEAIGFSPTAAERRLLKRLRHHVEWAGRYPVARSGMQRLRAPDGMLEPTTRADDLEAVKALARRLYGFYGQI
jgi:hypothetical protein